MTQKSYAEAMLEGLLFAMEEDQRINLVGSHLFGLGPQRQLSAQLREKFGERIIDPPISESAAVALGIGAAMAGDRPVIDIGTASFVFEAWSQLVNEAGPAHYMTGGQVSVPVVFHMLHGLRGGSAAQHGASPQAMLWNAPGLEIVLPASARDVKGLIRSALKSDNPTVIVGHAKLLGLEEEVPDEDYTIPFGVADIKREGRDLTMVATSLMVSRALEAAEQLAKSGIEAEVVDPRTLVPLDKAAILGSVAKTGRLVVIDEANVSCGVASEIAALVAAEGFADLKAPITRVCRPDVPVPFSPPLEERLTVTVERIVEAVNAG
ncbi:MAG: transketolase C-terminal domain-containing protein [Rhodospirillales bacterium]|jgi:pyruvate dehydrogenase E1 component beta subunit|nr:transketolase C-terminal domain-containing protein [Rhodospirillales bacterium]MDP6643317.1 transketolase C-terminal domain-containing protein [Rhodospirillales bacterium]MDP6840071.1 transketolase C-terminal domain-containing protein [Rhodospirillales bacterium]